MYAGKQQKTQNQVSIFFESHVVNMTPVDFFDKSFEPPSCFQTFNSEWKVEVGR